MDKLTKQELEYLKSLHYVTNRTIDKLKHWHERLNKTGLYEDMIDLTRLTGAIIKAHEVKDETD